MGTVDFQEWINELREMPSGASQWEFASQFIEETAHIVAEKEIERNRIAEVVGAIGDVIGEYSEELEGQVPGCGVGDYQPFCSIKPQSAA